MRRALWGACTARAPVFANLADEAKPLAGDGADQSLLIAAVADRTPHSGDPAAQRGIRNDAAIPHVRDQILLADHALAVLDEIVEEIKNLRLDGDGIVSTPQFPPVNIERAICENVDHHADPAVQRSCPFPREKTGKSQAIRYRKTVQPTNFGGVVLERSALGSASGGENSRTNPG